MTTKSMLAAVAAIAAFGAPAAHAQSSNTQYAYNPAHPEGKGGDPWMGCTTTINGQPAAWVRVEGSFSGTPAVLVVPTALMLRGGNIDFSVHNRVIGDRSATRDAIENGEMPYLTGLAGTAPMQQVGLAQPLQNTDEAYGIYDGWLVRDRPWTNGPFIEVSPAELCTGGVGRSRRFGRDSDGGSDYVPREPDLDGRLRWESADPDLSFPTEPGLPRPGRIPGAQDLERMRDEIFRPRGS